MKNHLKLSVISIFFLFIFATLGMALSLPHPIAGTVLINGNAAQADLVITDISNGGNSIISTNEYGQYIYDLANLPNEYTGRDQINVKINGCPNLDCSKTFSLSGGSETVNFDLTSQTAPNLKPVTKFVCSDGSIAIKESDCPKDANVILIASIVALVGVASLLGIRKGFISLAGYYKKKGDEAAKAGKKSEATKNYARAEKMLKTAIANKKK